MAYAEDTLSTLKRIVGGDVRHNMTRDQKAEFYFLTKLQDNHVSR